ncbi:MAG: SDR family oxidoreductase [Verrucomicrobia bacterium]|nr:SDR family oxidoreductase [Verrucomicrobiota bacterium]
MIIDRKDWRAVVTGSTAGIGRTNAEGLAPSGASLVINGRSNKRVAQAVCEMQETILQADVTGIVADVATPDGVADFVASAPDADTLLNNLCPAFSNAFEDVDDADWLKLSRSRL